MGQSVWCTNQDPVLDACNVYRNAWVQIPAPLITPAPAMCTQPFGVKQRMCGYFHLSILYRVCGKWLPWKKTMFQFQKKKFDSIFFTNFAPLYLPFLSLHISWLLISFFVDRLLNFIWRKSYRRRERKRIAYSLIYSTAGAASGWCQELLPESPTW